MKLPIFYIDDIIKRALSEDINYIDVATDYLIDGTAETTARIIAKDNGVLAGLDVFSRVFEIIDNNITIRMNKVDGDSVAKGDIIGTLSGRTASLLKGERTALNLLCHMSGIATATNAYVELVKGTNATICDTRKTLPSLRALQKYAVVAGGGRNHRFNLSDAAMLKDNHIDAYGGIIGAVKALRERVGHMVKIEVEARNLTELQHGLDAGADVIMLDNMDNQTMAKAVEITNGRAILEASGNITIDNVADVAKTGVDFISIGALTHSVKVFDISMVL